MRILRRGIVRLITAFVVVMMGIGSPVCFLEAHQAETLGMFVCGIISGTLAALVCAAAFHDLACRNDTDLGHLVREE